jgi:hypothetical protein
MKSPLRAALLTGLLVLALAPVDSAATSYRELSEAERVELSDLIVRGTVTEVWTEMEGGQVWTRASVEILRVYKGDSSMESVIVDQLGGEYAGITGVVHGVARFSAGEDVVLMLDHLQKSGRYSPLGMQQGKYTVLMDPWTRKEVVVKFSPPITEGYDHRFIPLQKDSARTALSELEQTLTRHIALGGGVQ